jgi:hypothetical protein
MKCPSTNLPSQTGLFANPVGYLSEFHQPFTWKPGLTADSGQFHDPCGKATPAELRSTGFDPRRASLDGVSLCPHAQSIIKKAARRRLFL